MLRAAWQLDGQGTRQPQGRSDSEGLSRSGYGDMPSATIVAEHPFIVAEI